MRVDQKLKVQGPREAWGGEHGPVGLVTDYQQQTQGLAQPHTHLGACTTVSGQACLLLDHQDGIRTHQDGSNTTPYEVWYGNKPDISRLHPFGCKAYVYIHPGKQKKLSPQVFKGIFVRYADTPPPMPWQGIVNYQNTFGACPSIFQPAMQSCCKLPK